MKNSEVMPESLESYSFDPEPQATEAGYVCFLWKSAVQRVFHLQSDEKATMYTKRDFKNNCRFYPV
ncbi:hypothetical protein [Bacillus sp. 2205SS5-2]|uniref:hypothetical protein n=1 Tax=Bacillus sp. 2205SS5-2 TaxID=3109031 RepID=UPI0030060AA7